VSKAGLSAAPHQAFEKGKKNDLRKSNARANTIAGEEGVVGI